MSILAGILSASRNYTEKQLKRILELLMYPYSTAPGTLTDVKSSSTPIHVVGTMVPLFRLMYWTLEALTFILMSVQIKSDEVV